MLFCLPTQLLGSSHGTPTEAAAWTSFSVKHVYGLPSAKAKDKGALSLNRTALNFAGKMSAATIPVASILAVSLGSERVELWGLKGRLLRMAIPNGGGLVAAAVMHHKVGMLTVEFNDGNGAYHSAVFVLPAREAADAVQSLAAMLGKHRERGDSSCTAGREEPGSVRVGVPTSDQLDVPTAYRGLVYERLIDRLHRSKGIRRVYRDGEMNDRNECPQYSIELSIVRFRLGSQVKRAMMGPVGMFVGTTQLTFALKVTDAGGESAYHAQVKATLRGESESINVTEAVAKKLAKQFNDVRNRMPKSTPAAPRR